MARLRRQEDVSLQGQGSNDAHAITRQLRQLDGVRQMHRLGWADCLDTEARARGAENQCEQSKLIDTDAATECFNAQVRRRRNDIFKVLEEG